MPAARSSAPGAAARSTSPASAAAGTTAPALTGSTRTGPAVRRRSSWWPTRGAGPTPRGPIRQLSIPGGTRFRQLTKPRPRPWPRRCRQLLPRLQRRQLRPPRRRSGAGGRRGRRPVGGLGGEPLSGRAAAGALRDDALLGPGGGAPTRSDHGGRTTSRQQEPPASPSPGRKVASRARIRDGGGTATRPIPGPSDGRSAVHPPLPFAAGLDYAHNRERGRRCAARHVNPGE